MGFWAEVSREGNEKKHKLQVSYEGSDFSFLYAKSASASEEVPPKGVIQTSQHEDQVLHM